MTRRRRTLRGRVAVVAIAVIAGWLAVLTVGFNVVLDHQLHLQAEDILRARADSAAATVRIDAAGHAKVIESSTDAALDSGIWIYSGRTAVQRPHGDTRLQTVADTLVDRGTRYADGHEARLYARPLTQHGRQVGTVVASVSLEPSERAEFAAIVGSIVVSLLLLIGSYPVLRLVGRRALQPVAQMTRQAREWSTHAPEERFGGSQDFAELHDLAGTLDDVLDRLSAVLRHERQVSAELSHELRTPLARIVAEVDLLLAREPNHVAYLAIRDTAHSMDGIIETLLTTARAELQTTSATCAVHAVADRLAALQPVPYRITGDLLVGVGSDVVERMLAPIFDNASRYAQHEVRVDIRREADQVVVEVSNDGPPLHADELETIFEPGYQGDRRDGHDGSGLGLALARRLARAAEGDVIAPETATGATFRISLPPG